MNVSYDEGILLWRTLRGVISRFENFQDSTAYNGNVLTLPFSQRYASTPAIAERGNRGGIVGCTALWDVVAVMSLLFGNSEA